MSFLPELNLPSSGRPCFLRMMVLRYLPCCADSFLFQLHSFLGRDFAFYAFLYPLMANIMHSIQLNTQWIFANRMNGEKIIILLTFDKYDVLRTAHFLLSLSFQCSCKDDHRRPILPLGADLGLRCVRHRSLATDASLEQPQGLHSHQFPRRSPEGCSSRVPGEHSTCFPKSWSIAWMPVQVSCPHANIGTLMGIPLIFTISISSFWCNGI